MHDFLQCDFAIAENVLQKFCFTNHLQKNAWFSSSLQFPKKDGLDSLLNNTIFNFHDLPLALFLQSSLQYPHLWEIYIPLLVSVEHQLKLPYVLHVLYFLPL